jgi:hypothetical protein
VGLVDHVISLLGRTGVGVCGSNMVVLLSMVDNLWIDTSCDSVMLFYLIAYTASKCVTLSSH